MFSINLKKHIQNINRNLLLINFLINFNSYPSSCSSGLVSVNHEDIKFGREGKVVPLHNLHQNYVILCTSSHGGCGSGISAFYYTLNLYFGLFTLMIIEKLDELFALPKPMVVEDFLAAIPGLDENKGLIATKVPLNPLDRFKPGTAALMIIEKLEKLFALGDSDSGTAANYSGTPIVGDFNKDGVDTIGLDIAKFYLHNSNTKRFADSLFTYLQTTYSFFTYKDITYKWKSLWKQIIDTIHKKKAKFHAINFFEKKYENYKKSLRCKLLKLRNNLESLAHLNQQAVLHKDHCTQDIFLNKQQLCFI